MELAARAMGFQSLSGPARSRIAALRQYGLLDAVAGGGHRVSERAFTMIMRPLGSPEFIAATQEAALSPDIFRELYENKAEASDDNIEWYLMNTRKFYPDGARRLLRAFRGTLAFAKLDSGDYDEGMGEVIDEDNSVLDTRTNLGQTRSTSASTARQFSFPLLGMTAQVSFTQEPTPAAWDALIRYLNIAKELATGGTPAAPRETREDDEDDAEGDKRPVMREKVVASSLSSEAQDLLRKVNAGGVPAFATDNLVRIAKENGVPVSPDMTPNQIIDGLQQRAN